MFDFEATACPNCAKQMDACSSPEPTRGPEPGDGSICLYCGHLAIFGDDMKLRHPTDREIEEIAGDPQLIAAMRIRGEAHNVIERLRRKDH